MTRPRIRAGLALAIALLAFSSYDRAQAPDLTVAGIVERAGRYVEAYEQEFSAVVCEERQVQKLVRPDGSVHRQRTSTSDFLLIKTSSVWMQAFRDVIEVDGKPVRNREDRLRKLFLQPSAKALAQAEAISKESTRYNIGVTRRGVSPLLPIRIVTARLASGFHFTRSGESILFDEFRSPSYLRYMRNGQVGDLMSHGLLVVDPASGRILAAELTADSPLPAFSTTMKVRYQEDPQLKILVPIAMDERYWKPQKPKDDRLEVTSSYVNFRRFQVTTDEKIKAPLPD